MDTTNLNINPSTGDDANSEKAKKAKKIAGKAAQFVGAAGLGVAGTMAANAMNTDSAEGIDDDHDASTETSEDGTTEELHAEPTTDFNPNDIMIDVDEVVVEDVETIPAHHFTNQGEFATVEPQPITGDDPGTLTTGEVLIADVEHPDEPYIDVEPVMYGGPDGWDDFDHDDLLADHDNPSDDVDIADDILA